MNHFGGGNNCQRFSSLKISKCLVLDGYVFLRGLTQVTFILRNQNGKQAWIFHQQILRKTVCINYLVNSLTYWHNALLVYFQIAVVLKTISAYIGVCLLMHTVCLTSCLLKFKLSCFFSLIYFSPHHYLVSVVVGIVYKDLNDLLAPDQPIRIRSGNRR